jgi:hypothetical protein
MSRRTARRPVRDAGTKMRIRKPNKKKKTIGPIGVVIIVLVLMVPIGAAGIGALYLMEDMERPVVALFPDIDAVSLKKEFTVKPRTPDRHQVRHGHRRPGAQEVYRAAQILRRHAKIRSGDV